MFWKDNFTLPKRFSKEDVINGNRMLPALQSLGTIQVMQYNGKRDKAYSNKIKLPPDHSLVKK